MIIWVNDNDLEAFLPLIPVDMQNDVKSGEWLCLGALADSTEPEGEKADEKVAAGVLLFSSAEGVSNGEDPTVMIRLHWIYVAPDYRQKGIGNALMDALSDVLKDNPADGILCDVPFGSEYDLAEAFLADWGFAFDVIESPEVTLTKEDGRNYNEKKKHAKTSNLLSENNGVCPLKDIPPEAFRKALHAIISQTPNPFYRGISDDPEIYDGELSCAVMKEDAVSSLLLFEKQSEERYQLVMMSSLSQNPAIELKDLITYSAVVFYLKRPEEAGIHVNLGSERSMSLFSYFFPDKELVLLRRGYYA